MATAWLFTLPSAALVGAGAYALAHGIGGSAGVIIDLIILLAIAAVIYWRSRVNKVDHNNVNDDWAGSVAPSEPEATPRPERQGRAAMSWINLSALWKIVVYGLVAGAGLPAMFAIGLRALALPGGARVQTAVAGGGADSDSDRLIGGNVLGIIIAAIMFPGRPGRHRLGHLRGLPDRHPAPAKK